MRYGEGISRVNTSSRFGGVFNNAGGSRWLIRYKFVIDNVKVVKRDHGLKFSINRKHSTLLIEAGVTDRTYALIEDPGRGVSFMAKMRFINGRFYVHIPRRLADLYEKGELVSLVVTPLGKASH